ncbi:MAG: hypothetical protein MUE68_12215 [Bacteroidetes bacterium]|nr:hypothetical protein [Bacteroidota bacterium]
MNSSVVLGIAGTAKNTGKTTALNALLEEAHARRVPVAVTSIGYDGEAVDNVTGLPKPRIVLQPGTIATTSVACLPRTGYEVVEETEWSTALGRILIVRCIEAGPIVLAGPSTRRDLAAIVERMRGLGPSLTLVDGALNRLAPMSAASALIVSTGAARSDDLRALALETAAIEAIFSIAAASPAAGSSEIQVGTPFASIEDVRGALERNVHREARLFLRAPVAPSLLHALANTSERLVRVRSIVLPDPVAVLLSADVVEMQRSIEACRASGIDVTVARTLKLAAVTVNPFIPRLEGHRYVADAVHGEDLRRTLRSAVHSPVIDVVHDGGRALWEALSPALAV